MTKASSLTLQRSNFTATTGVARGRAAALVKPATTDEVAAVVRFCNANNLKVVPQGGLTGVVAGGSPIRDGDEVLVSLARGSIYWTLPIARSGLWRAAFIFALQHSG